MDGRDGLVGWWGRNGFGGREGWLDGGKDDCLVGKEWLHSRREGKEEISNNKLEGKKGGRKG